MTKQADNPTPVAHYVRRKVTKSGDVQYTLDTSKGDVVMWTDPNKSKATPRPVIEMQRDGLTVREPLKRNIYVAASDDGPEVREIVRGYSVESLTLATRAKPEAAATAGAATEMRDALVAAGDPEALAAYFKATYGGTIAEGRKMASAFLPQ